MKRVYIGIDAHKESNVLALAFSGKELQRPVLDDVRAVNLSFDVVLY